MNRREFNKAATATVAASLFGPNLALAASKERYVSAYYLRAHTYTLVPSQVKEDMQWMASLGTNAVCLGILEQDLFAAVENVAIICEEAKKVGMEVLAVPSRWGGITAGAPKVPSLFTIKNEDTWMKHKDGSYVESSVSGRISSIYHPKTRAFIKETISKCLELWPLKGFIWDEPKMIMPDYSEAANKYFNGDLNWNNQKNGITDFFSEIGKHIKSVNPKIENHLFAYAHLKDDEIDMLAKVKDLDYFGCDGRPWPLHEEGTLEGSGKALIGKDAGERFLEAAKKYKKKSLMLIENHNLPDKDVALMDKYMPQLFDLSPDHLIYYYYPRNIENPNKNMNVIKKHISMFTSTKR